MLPITFFFYRAVNEQGTNIDCVRSVIAVFVSFDFITPFSLHV